eukprot:XP_001693105.1 triacylglycerol lipase-like protein [Chlamydomonas reinhardtii]
MSQLLSHFVRVPTFASPDQVLREARDKERELQNARAPTDVSGFLAPVGVWELKHLRKLSSLTSLTYYMHLVTPRRLQLMHGLDLVVTSRACDVRPYEHNRTAEECGADGDGMAVSFAEARQGADPADPGAPNTSGKATAASIAAMATAELRSRRLGGTEWFVVDDPASATRIFVIQGSDTLDHWKLNLTFDPVVFEEPALGVKVHRGVYEAALVLYERFLPLVYEHLEASPFSKVTFTGHSIGGSMATLLMLMYRNRGVLPPHSIATVYTFGAPAVFCQQQQPASCACGVDGLLTRLGLAPHVVRNVVMARDVVPRAFACDYSLVADILKGWGPAFREHCCLNRHGRKHLYYFVGRMCILQPDAWHSFVGGDPEHPMLPPGPELYALAEPEDAAAARAHYPALSDLPILNAVVEAVWEIMDNPHPLETLADPGAYLASGSISRYHNPEHYTKALGRLTHLKRLAERRQHPHGQAQQKQAQPQAGEGGIRSMFAGRNIRSFGGGVRSGSGSGSAGRRGLLHQQAASNGTAADAVLASGAAGAAAAAWGSAPQLADLVSGNGGRASAGYEGGVWDSSDGLDLHLSDFMGASAVGAADPHACR